MDFIEVSAHLERSNIQNLYRLTLSWKGSQIFDLAFLAKDDAMAKDAARRLASAFLAAYGAPQVVEVGATFGGGAVGVA